MRIIALLVISTFVVPSSAWAQTYDPAYPFCLQTYGIDGGYISCSYNSMEQCKMSASGRAAQCVANPYFGYRRR